VRPQQVAAWRDGKTVDPSPEDCRRLLDAPGQDTPSGVRDAAILAVLAYSACRVGELAQLRVGDYKSAGGHKVLEIYGKGAKSGVPRS
jgi:integrase/recombinase XerD